MFGSESPLCRRRIEWIRNAKLGFTMEQAGDSERIPTNDNCNTPKIERLHITWVARVRYLSFRTSISSALPDVAPIIERRGT